MKKTLTKRICETWYFVEGERVEGVHERLSGDCSLLSGDCSGLSGNCSRLYGNCSLLSGDCSRLSGDCSGLSGDLDECDITEEERKKGIKISDLVREEEVK